ncbi:MAG: Protein fmp52, mitochondrial [Watsoniomyces obsoletus]|nr:MAG: Protein fmp52, mitochondrial [Watsoniomyces obsoletus]
MYAAKRKFHNLLESLSGEDFAPAKGGRTQDAAATTSIEGGSHPKQPRGASYPRKSTLGMAGREVGRQASPRKVQKSTGSQSSSSQPPASFSLTDIPNYAPWSREQFLNRLKTFRFVDRWSTKPDRVNEVQWAKRGWTCVGKERVGCIGGCGKEVYIKLGASEHHLGGDEGDIADEEEQARSAQESEDTLVERYADLIVTGHDEDCLWRKRGCADDVYQIYYTRERPTLTQLKERYESLRAMSAKLPARIKHPLKPSQHLHYLMEMLPLIVDGHRDWPQMSEERQNEWKEHPPEMDALILAIFGWEGDNSHPKGLISCNACFRRVGLWLYQGKDERSPRSPSDPTRSTSMSDDDAVSELDVITEHREYCPWISTITQTESRMKPESGWESLVRQLLSWYDQRRSNTDERPRRAAEGGEEREQQERQSQRNVPLEGESGTGILSVEPRRQEDTAARDAKDKERFARVKELKKAFDVKALRKK